MKILVITNLFPNNKEPNRGVFNKQQIVELAKLCELQVVAPIAWHRASGIPCEEKIEGLKVSHPRYFMIPKIGRSLYGFFFYLGIIVKVKEIYETFKFDMILATWVYPDGFGTALVSKVLNKPLVIKVHGSDVNLSFKYLLRRKMISYAFKKAEKIIAVSNALKEKIIGIGVPSKKIEVISNGIDTDLFKPMDKIECRKKLGLPLDKKIVLYAGNLEKVKGIDILVEAIKGLPEDLCLVIVGEGSLMQDTRTQGHKDTKLKDRITFAGARSHNEIPIWMNAADIFCLPSRNEGCPNVLLEALSCGVPIVASKVGGIPDIITSEEYGIMVNSGDALALSQGIKKALEKKWNYTALREHISDRSWKNNAEMVFNEFKNIKEPIKIKNKILKEFVSSAIPRKWIIWNGSRNHDSNSVALTFDDGPNPEYTPKVLGILNRYNIRASFFLLGQEVSKYKDLTKRINTEGHSIGNHTYSHNSKKIMDEILKTQDILKNTINKNTRLFRPPRGTLTVDSLKATSRFKLTNVLWSKESGDWKKNGKTSILENLNIDTIKSGDIILMHDDNDFTLEALPIVIEKLKNRGFQFVTVEELIKD